MCPDSLVSGGLKFAKIFTRVFRNLANDMSTIIKKFTIEEEYIKKFAYCLLTIG